MDAIGQVSETTIANQQVGYDSFYDLWVGILLDLQELLYFNLCRIGSLM